ncbi:hypothetical protein [Dictyobacter formicarum]|uniref:Response regulatory domain-containing protein n=1 Tax=Dictyobacter formicarum TaxID=2778368 RepID=A0ABQ3V9G7_9CHLR|nr:hypothetical protein [Dictyobacter formicarum]GHO82453.1 hypothetical protein KSZ_04590 [Dictyobacter formicarum]
MGKKVLVAESREGVRTELCTVFQKDTSVSTVSEAATYEEVKKHLSCFDHDLIVINQALMTDIKVPSLENFALLIDEPDLDMLMYAYEHRARGYFSFNVAADLLSAALSSTRETFLIDPVLVPRILKLSSERRKCEDAYRIPIVPFSTYQFGTSPG